MKLKAENSLRALSRAYATGKYSFEQYRFERQRLLNELQSTEVLSRKAMSIWSYEQLSYMLKTSGWYVLAIAAVVIISAGGYAIKGLSGKRDVEGKPAVVFDHVQADVAICLPGGSSEHTPEQLVHCFLEKTDWSKNAVIRLQRKLENIPAEQLLKAKESEWFSTFAELVLLYLENQEQRASDLQLELDYKYINDFIDFIGINRGKQPERNGHVSITSTVEQADATTDNDAMDLHKYGYMPSVYSLVSRVNDSSSISVSFSGELYFASCNDNVEEAVGNYRNSHRQDPQIIDGECSALFGIRTGEARVAGMLVEYTDAICERIMQQRM